MSEVTKEPVPTRTSRELGGIPLGRLMYGIAVSCLVMAFVFAFMHHEQTARFSSSPWSFATWLILVYWFAASLSCIVVGYFLNTLNKILWAVSSAEDREKFFN